MTPKLMISALMKYIILNLEGKNFQLYQKKFNAEFLIINLVHMYYLQTYQMQKFTKYFLE